MTQEEKELLLKDLSARLSYRVIGEYSWKGNEPHNRELTGNLYDELNSSWSSTGDSKFIPYLRPMSSMTEEEKKEYYIFQYKFTLQIYEYQEINKETFSEYLVWLNAHHFDYCGLIERCLAIAVTEENNPYK